MVRSFIVFIKPKKALLCSYAQIILMLIVHLHLVLDDFDSFGQIEYVNFSSHPIDFFISVLILKI